MDRTEGVDVNAGHVRRHNVAQNGKLDADD